VPSKLQLKIISLSTASGTSIDILNDLDSDLARIFHIRAIKHAPRSYHPYLVESLWWRHRCLDGQAANILPSLFQERDKVVNSQHDVGDQLILGHLNVSDSDTHTQDLLQLEFDGGLDFIDLGAEIFVVGNWGWEFTSLGETGTQETRNLLDQGVGSDKGIVLASKLFNQLLVLVELL